MASSAEEPIWKDRHPSRTFPSLEENLSCDVLIVGAGITGITTAFLLRQSGLNVVLVDRQQVLAGDTGRTTAHVTNLIDLRPEDLLNRFGEKIASRVWDAGSSGMKLIHDTVESLGISCELAQCNGHLFASLDPHGKDDPELVKDHFFAAMDNFPEAVELDECVPPFGRMAVRFSGQYRFDPVLYASGLLDHATRAGVRVYEQTAVSEFDSRARSVRAGKHTIRCERVILATHSPLDGFAGKGRGALTQTKVAAYSTYAISGVLRDESIPDGFYWDCDDPYRYLRIESRDGLVVAIYGGGDHKTGQCANPQRIPDRLADELRQWFPSFAPQRHWSGQVWEPVDGLPFIGKNETRQFIATGFAGNGMVFGTVAALMARDFAIGAANPWEDLFAVDRKSLSSVGTYLAENKDFPVHMVKDRLSAGSREDFVADDVHDGAVVKTAHGLAAVSQNRDGEETIRSAICPHMGCIVQWNQIAKTWDCPCHGSRFDRDGRVFAGPAHHDLKPIEGAADTSD